MASALDINSANPDVSAFRQYRDALSHWSRGTQFVRHLMAAGIDPQNQYAPSGRITARAVRQMICKSRIIDQFST